MSERRPIPVVLLTGALGSGKTTLLSAWLRQPALQHAALVVNEIGEVGFDERLLLPIMPSGEGSLLANACVCCSGLPGLEEAMADLWRARLERRVEWFESLVIETTGMAEPQPVRKALATHALLRERYELLGVVTTVSATLPPALCAREEFLAQVRGADLLVVTKTDRVDGTEVESLVNVLRSLNPNAALASSAQADLGAEQALRLLRERPPAQVDTSDTPEPTPHEQTHEHEHAHRHDAEAVFAPLPHPLPRGTLAQALGRCVRAGAHTLLRLKGVVMADDGLALAVQWAPGDEEVAMAPFTQPLPRTGLTVIATSAQSARELAQGIEALARKA